MKKYLKFTLLATLLSNLLMADVVFDLGAQQLSNSVDGNYVDATYDAGDSIVSTGLAQVNGYYRPKEYRSGHFSVQVKQPQTQWTVAFNMYAKIYNDGSSMTLTSSSGQAVNIYIGRSYISVAGTTKDTNIEGKEVISGTIQMNGNNIDIIINGSYVFHVSKPNFKLEQFNMILASDSTNNINDVDKLNNLTISTSN